MKPIFQIIYLIILTSSVCHSQTTSENELLLSKTYRFIYGQEYILKTIKHNFPELKNKAENAELAFNKTFGTAVDYIYIETEELYNKEYDTFLATIKSELNELSKHKQKSKQDALHFINHVHKRSQGHIKSPFLEILLAYKYKNNPIDEFLDNYVKTYSVTSFINSKKIDLSLKVPVSWKELDGNSSTTLKKIRSEYGTGNVTITLNTKKLSKIDISNNNHDQISQFDQANSITGYIENRNIVKHLLLSENNALQITLTIYGTSDSEIDLQFEKFNSLYESIIKSILLGKEHKKNNLLTYKI